MSTAPCPWNYGGEPSFPHHTGTYPCACPMCTVSFYIAFLYRNQRRSSSHVIQSRPSPSFVDTPLAELACPSGVEWGCPVHRTFGFCPYLNGCYMPHDANACGRPRVPRAGSADAELQRLIAKAAAHRDQELWHCDVCGLEGIDEWTVSPVGETFWYRYCPRCSLSCYFPYVTYLVEAVMQSIGDDYNLYKTEIDRYRRLLPDEFKVPLTFEAHRVASVVFAWSLLSPQDAKDAIESAYRNLPEMEAVVSVGSGTGYIEHVFNRILHKVIMRPEWEVDRARHPVSSFDGVRAVLGAGAPASLPFFAFDELALRTTYSVHVCLGGPLVMLSLNCPKTALLLCWPPFGSPQEEQSSMAFEALEYFTHNGGRVVIYIGDVASTGDWRFHQLLYSHYRLVKDYSVRRELRRWSPQEMGLVYAGNDTIGVYRRRDAPNPLQSNNGHSA
ncbi:hypothetical protein STCU_01064 [Strigomonas culicis]|uniref:C3H1-type domain-containing protein n=1 Tax=Strigomonas culicis TaxID=28005 RepID=S9WIE9_9TRYP|nr:hypothetical protein STCU_01064 [Strigomonas culicis]|eukprot:EPY35610.1 hypothetical protein STCU_01064 [Strigomonas culicis]